jgi:4-hydroxybenzoate polyprenyltransferase
MNRLLKSQLIVALCALALGTETYMVTGLKPAANELGLIFFATLLIYNIAQLRFNLSKRVMGKMKISLTGNRLNILLSIISLLFSLSLLITVNHGAQLVFILTSAAAITYVMPFSYKGDRLKGMREIPVLKNILLSAVWALGTVAVPLAFHNSFEITDDVWWMMARRFLFVYSLTVIFDIRDKKYDRELGILTLPMVVGIKNTKLLAVLALVAFIIITLFDSGLDNIPLMHYRESLILSAVITIMLVAIADLNKKNSYYIVVVDGSMIIQFLIVAAISFL